MGRPLRLLNFALGLVAALIAGALAKTWVSPVVPNLSPALTKPSQEAEALTYSPIARPPLAQFDILLEKNPFKQPPPVASQPAPPPIPTPTLIGTMLVGHERKAILNDRGKANIYAVGQDVAGGTVTDIREDRVLYKRGDAVSEITLKAPIQRGAAAPAASATPPVGRAPVPSVIPPPPAQAIEGSPTTPTSPLSPVERRRLRILQQRGLLGRPQDREQ